MSIELYKLLTDKYMLYKELEKSINALKKAKSIPQKKLIMNQEKF